MVRGGKVERVGHARHEFPIRMELHRGRATLRVTEDTTEAQGVDTHVMICSGGARAVWGVCVGWLTCCSAL